MAVMIGVILIVRLGAKALEGMLELAQLGLLNRLAGLLLYLILTLSVAALVFYVVQWGGVIPSEISDESWFAQYVQPFFIEGLKKAAQRMPGFREMFQQFEHFFEQLPS
jgi:membrane protein required for colicin V production